MDVMLKSAMRGTDAAVRIGGELKIPVVYLTANADDQTFFAALDSSPFGYVLKPFQDRELQIAIEIALYKHRLDRERDALILNSGGAGRRQEAADSPAHLRLVQTRPRQQGLLAGSSILPGRTRDPQRLPRLRRQTPGGSPPTSLPRPLCRRKRTRKISRSRTGRSIRGTSPRLDLIWNRREQNRRPALLLPEIVLGRNPVADLFFLFAANMIQSKWHPLGCKLPALLLPSGVLC